MFWPWIHKRLRFLKKEKAKKNGQSDFLFRMVLCVPHKVIYTSHFASLTFGLGYKFMKKKNLCFTVCKRDFWVDEDFCHNDLIHHSNLAGSLVTDYYFSSFSPPNGYVIHPASSISPYPFFLSLALSLPTSLYKSGTNGDQSIRLMLS